MRILQVTYWRFPSTGAIDGYLRTLRVALRAAGHRVDILSRGPHWRALRLHGRARLDLRRRVEPQVVAELWPRFADLAPPPSEWVRQREGEHYAFERGALRLCDLRRYDLAHCHDVHSARAIARAAPDLPVLLTCHGLLAFEWLVEDRLPAGDPWAWRYAYWRERLGLAAAKLALVPSVTMRDAYATFFGADPARIAVLPYGLDPRPWTASWRRRRRRPSGAPPTVTCVARLVPLKGHRVLLEALAALRARHPRLRCWLVGDGPLAAELRQHVRALGLEGCVRLWGRRDDVPRLLAATDVFVLPSLQEVTPLAITEAQLAGLPVVATDVGGIPELVRHGESGWLVPPGDARALAAALDAVLSDPGLARRLGEAGRAAALAERTWDRHWERLLAVYRAVART